MLAALLLLAVNPDAARGQETVRVSVAQENFRRDPGGAVLATVPQGAELRVLQDRGSWVQAELVGWIWAPSLAETDRDGFDLRVQADGGENLRVQPQGQVQARVFEGCLLERLASDGNWHQVRRAGWLWKASLEVSGGPATDPGGATQPQPVGETEISEPALITAPASLVIHSTPDGDTVALFQPGAQAQVLGRTGDWVRVRVDGWVYGPAALDTALNLVDTGDLTPAQLRSDPGRYRGALIRWRVQFISLRRAERARTDFEEGEPFIHARGPSGEQGFVYLAVPDDLLPVAEALEPLEYVTVVGRVRTGRSTLLGSPVIDLTDIEPEVPQD